jgi:hypothetical protein
MADTKLGAEVASAVLAWMAAQKLESVVIFGLLAFFQAKVRGIGMPARDVLSQQVSRPSLVSWLIARSLCGGYIGAPSVSEMHSETAPAMFQADPFFLQHAENFVPPVYLERAKHIDRKYCRGFLAQWGFEWTRLVEVGGFKLRMPYIDFWMRQDDDHLACLDLPLSEVYRSGFLRGLAWAVEGRMITPSHALWLSAQTCPIDLGLWGVLPGKQPEAWPSCSPSGDSVDTLPGTATAELGGMWQRQFDQEWLIAEASGRIQESGDSAYDLEIVGIIQSCYGPRSPNIDAICGADTARAIAEEAADRLVFGGRYRHSPAEDWQERHSDWSIWRLAGQADPNAVPRWQWWRFHRAVWLPSPFLARDAFDFRCTPEALVIEEDSRDIGRWIDWTYKLQEMTTGNLTPATGQMLLIRRSLVEKEAAKLGGVFAWICKITAYQRKHSYSAFVKTHFALAFGTTRIVRDA